MASLGAVVYAATTGGFEKVAEEEEIETTKGPTEDDREDAASAKAGDEPQGKKATFGPRDERQVVGESTDVFFGRVVERSGSEKAPPIGSQGFREPQTQYAVEVTQTIKGGLSGKITVNRRGGSPGAPDAPGGGSFLETGREHLFATGYVETKGWHQIVLPDSGIVEVEDESYRDELERRYQEAYANRIKVNIPLPPTTPEEVDELKYRPCWPDGSTPPGWARPCDPSDPLPSGAASPKEKEMLNPKAPQDTK